MNNTLYTTEQIKKAISILETMLLPDAPELSEEFHLYYEYMQQHSKAKIELQNKLNNVERKINKKMQLIKPITASE
jgi:hypothetical protein